MGFELSKFSPDMQAKIKAAFNNDKNIDEVEAKELGLTKIQADALTRELIGDGKDYTSQDTFTKKGEDGSRQTLTLYSDKQEGILNLTPDSILYYRSKYPNVEIKSAYLKNGIITMLDGSGNPAIDSEGNRITVSFRKEKTEQDSKMDLVSFYLNHNNGDFDVNKLLAMQQMQERLNSLSESDESYLQLKSDIEVEKLKMMSYDERKNYITSQMWDAYKKGDISSWVSAIGDFYNYECEQIDDALKIRQAKDWVKDKTHLNDLIAYIDKCVDDKTDGLTFMETAWEIVKGVGDSIDSFIGAQGLTMMAGLGAATGAVNAIPKVGGLIGGAIQAYFGTEGAILIGSGAIEIATAQTKEQVRAGGASIGLGIIMAKGAKESVQAGFKNLSIKEFRSRISQAKTIKELNILKTVIKEMPYSKSEKQMLEIDCTKKQNDFLQKIDAVTQELKGYYEKINKKETLLSDEKERVKELENELHSYGILTARAPIIESTKIPMLSIPEPREAFLPDFNNPEQLREMGYTQDAEGKWWHSNRDWYPNALSENDVVYVFKRDASGKPTDTGFGPKDELLSLYVRTEDFDANNIVYVDPATMEPGKPISVKKCASGNFCILPAGTILFTSEGIVEVKPGEIVNIKESKNSVHTSNMTDITEMYKADPLNPASKKLFDLIEEYKAKEPTLTESEKIALQERIADTFNRINRGQKLYDILPETEGIKPPETLREEYDVASKVATYLETKYLSKIDVSDFDTAIQQARGVLRDIYADKTLTPEQRQAGITAVMVKLLPKTNAHQHTKGSLPKETAYELARQKNYTPEQMAELEWAYSTGEKGFETLTEFNKAYGIIGKLVTTPADYKIAIEGIIRKAVAEGQLTTEIRCACDSLKTEDGRYLSMQEGTDIILNAIEEVKTKLRAEGKEVPATGYVFLSYRGKDWDASLPAAKAQAEQAVKTAQEHPDMKFGFDIAGPEDSGWGPKAFNEALSVIRDYNAKVDAGEVQGQRIGITVHAGETPTFDGGRPGYLSVQEAIEMGADRIGHGVQAVLDEATMQMMKDADVTVEICGVCNILSIPVNTEGLQIHPIQQFIDRGINLSLCTDNDAICGSGITKEYMQFLLTGHSSFMNWNNVKESARDGIDAAFIPKADKVTAKQKLETRIGQIQRLVGEVAVESVQKKPELKSKDVTSTGHKEDYNKCKKILDSISKAETNETQLIEYCDELLSYYRLTDGKCDPVVMETVNKINSQIVDALYNKNKTQKLINTEKSLREHYKDGQIPESDYATEMWEKDWNGNKLDKADKTIDETAYKTCALIIDFMGFDEAYLNSPSGIKGLTKRDLLINFSKYTVAKGTSGNYLELAKSDRNTFENIMHSMLDQYRADNYGQNAATIYKKSSWPMNTALNSMYIPFVENGFRHYDNGYAFDFVGYLKENPVEIQRINELSSLIDSCPLKHKSVTYRGGQLNELDVIRIDDGKGNQVCADVIVQNFLSENPNAIGSEIEEFVFNLLQGRSLTKPRYMSATCNRDLAVAWATGNRINGGKQEKIKLVWKIHADEGAKALFMEHVNNIGNNYYDQFEFLFQRSTTLNFMNCHFNEKTGILELEVKVEQPKNLGSFKDLGIPHETELLTLKEIYNKLKDIKDSNPQKYSDIQKRLYDAANELLNGKNDLYLKLMQDNEILQLKDK